jgi:hypothetical protein
MIGSTSRISRYAKVVCAVMIALCALLGPVKSYAQSGQVIVMVCTLGDTRTTVTLDLARKTVAVISIYQIPGGSGLAPRSQTIGPIQGTVARITDQQITFSYIQGGQLETATLNRYTGDLTNKNVYGTSQWRCQKQQKQF